MRNVYKTMQVLKHFLQKHVTNYSICVIPFADINYGKLGRQSYPICKQKKHI